MRGSHTKYLGIQEDALAVATQVPILGTTSLVTIIRLDLRLLRDSDLFVVILLVVLLSSSLLSAALAALATLLGSRRVAVTARGSIGAFLPTVELAAHVLEFLDAVADGFGGALCREEESQSVFGSCHTCWREEFRRTRVDHGRKLFELLLADLDVADLEEACEKPGFGFGVPDNRHDDGAGG